MDFFKELLTSYALLKKRKLSITLDEGGVSTDTQGTGQAPTYGAIKVRAENRNPQAIEVIGNTDAHMEIILPGVDIAAGTIKGKVNDGGQGAINSVSLSDEMDLIAHPGTKNPDAPTPDSDKSNGEGKERTGGLCGTGVVFKNNPGKILIYRTCSIGGTTAKEYRTMVARHFWRGGLNSEEYAEKLAPDVLYLQNSKEGSYLLSIFKDSPDILEMITNLMVHGWDGEKPSDSFFDPEKSNSIFGVMAQTMREQGNRHVDLFSIDEEVLIEVKADELHTFGAVHSIIKALFIIDPKNKPISADDAEWMKDNVFFIKDRSGRLQLYFNAGDSTGVNFTSTPHIHDKFVQQFVDYNNNVSEIFKDEDDPDLFKLYEINREVIYNHSDAKLKSQKVITDVSEEISPTIILTEGRNPHNRSPEDRSRIAAGIYHDLQNSYGHSINEAIRVVDTLPEENIALTEGFEALIEAFDQLKQIFNPGETREQVLLDTKRFFSKIQSLVRQKVIDADADYVVRVGTGGGAKGFKTDQLYLYRAGDPTGLDRASTFMGGKTGGFDPTTQRFQDIVRGSVTRGYKDPVTGKRMKSDDKDLERRKVEKWEETKSIWGCSDDEEVYIGYDSLKWNSPLQGSRSEIETGGGRKIDSVAKEFVTSLSNFTEGKIDTTTTEGRQEQKWVNGMLDLVGTRGERDSAGVLVPEAVDRTQQVLDNVKELDDLNDRLSTMHNASTARLSVPEVRREFWKALQNAPGLDLTEKEINALVITEGVDPHQQLLNKKNKSKVERLVWFNRIKQGLSDPDKDTRVGWQHTVSMLQAQQAFDSNGAWDTIADGTRDRVARHKRDATLRRSLDPFMASKDPAGYIKWSESSYSIAEPYKDPETGRTKYRGRLKYSIDTDTGKVATTFAPDESYWEDASTLDTNSTEYSPTELMNKLLEVQQLMFTHLIKE